MSSLPDASMVPSGLKAMVLTQSEWLLRRLNFCGLFGSARFHKIMVLSELADASKVGVGGAEGNVTDCVGMTFQYADLIGLAGFETSHKTMFLPAMDAMNFPSELKTISAISPFS